MQIYLTSHEAEADFLNLVQQTLETQQLQNDFKIEALPAQQQDKQRIIEPISATAITVLVTALGAGGAITVGMGKDGAITQLVKVFETLINRQVQVKIEHNGTLIELSGSAGHVKKALENLLK